MNIQVAKNIVNAVSKVTLNKNLLCVYRHTHQQQTNVPCLVIPLQNILYFNNYHLLPTHYRTVFMLKENRKESIDWDYCYNPGYNDCKAVISWRDEVEKQIEEMVELIATATQKIDTPMSTIE